jgi:hypothetical protein
MLVARRLVTLDLLPRSGMANQRFKESTKNCLACLLRCTVWLVPEWTNVGGHCLTV